MKEPILNLNDYCRSQGTTLTLVNNAFEVCKEIYTTWKSVKDEAKIMKLKEFVAEWIGGDNKDTFEDAYFECLRDGDTPYECAKAGMNAIWQKEADAEEEAERRMEMEECMQLEDAKQILNENGYLLESIEDNPRYKLYLELKKEFEGGEKPSKSNGNEYVKVGDIFVECFSWEYTKHETFYKVVGVTDSSLKLAELEAKLVKEGAPFRPAKYEPIDKIAKDGKKITKRYKVDEEGDVHISSNQRTVYWYRYKK